MQLQWVDIAILVIMGLSVLTGLFRGFVKELVALCVWIIAIWLAIHYSHNLDPWLTPYIKEQSARTAAGFVIILLGTLLAGGIFNAILGSILKRTGLSGTDKTLGMMFGFLRGVFIVALIMLAIKMTSLPYEQYSKESLFYARFEPVVNWLYPYMPQFIKKVQTVEQGNIIDTVPIG